MEMLNQKQKIIAGLVIAIVIIVIAYYYINSTKEVYTSQYEGNILEETNEEENILRKEELMKIHITGAVKSNGIVQIEKNARINDAIEAAGGLTEDADLTNINLAYMIEDGQKIYIPSIDDKKGQEAETNVLASENQTINGQTRQKQETTFIFSGPGYGITEEKEEKGNKININKATLMELITLPGIGEATAVKIIEYRKTSGSFKTIEEIKNVPGIGDAKYNVIKEFISV